MISFIKRLLGIKPARPKKMQSRVNKAKVAPYGKQVPKKCCSHKTSKNFTKPVINQDGARYKNDDIFVMHNDSRSYGSFSSSDDSSSSSSYSSSSCSSSSSSSSGGWD